jgi:hypothetical protein
MENKKNVLKLSKLQSKKILILFFQSSMKRKKDKKIKIKFA